MSQLKFTSLGSGSKGNATVVGYDEALILIDSGFSCKLLETRLAERAIDCQHIKAILVTHEHSDHFNGVPTFSNRYGIPVWMSHGTSLNQKAEKIKALNVFNSHSSFQIEQLEVQPVLVPHDSREACQFVIRKGSSCLGILTDLGHITPFVSQQYKDCQALLLEFNHDIQMLMSGRYPPALKARVSGSLGHLSNDQAIDFLKNGQLDSLKFLAAMHLSEENNCRHSVLDQINGLSLDSVEVTIACQENGFDWVSI
ncbi:MBL fold metallo-hydrolase [Aliikangiella marina]|uniref:MBL fold metallo-hydrolase n=1 Tax=Aliikangiella marina TaxID=1712262 RepID=UPI00163D53EF|nr:MBL fold metallo-hydrolase [Aliikangiella marina]